jgi:hypothetical protein
MGVAAAADEIEHLTKGNLSHMTEGTETMKFILVTAIPQERQGTYLKIVAADKPHSKANPKRVRFTMGGDKVNYPGDVSTKTANLTTAKCLFNSVLSTPLAPSS